MLMFVLTDLLVRLCQRREVHPRALALRLRQRLQRLERRGRLQQDDLRRELLPVLQRPVHLQQVEVRSGKRLSSEFLTSLTKTFILTKAGFLTKATFLLSDSSIYFALFKQ